MDKKKIIKIVNRFNNTKIMIIGDIMLDKFVWGKVSRICPEAPVPIVEIEKETHMPGGAGNVAFNINALGGKVILVGVIGNDFEGDTLIEKMSQKDINVTGIFRDNNHPTILKTRIIAHHQQVVRADREIKGKISNSIIKKMLDFLENNIVDAKAVIISDYGKGVICSSILRKAIKLATEYKKPIVVDPKIEHFSQYKNVTCITPNHQEAVAGMRLHKIQEGKALIQLGKRILKKLKSDSVLITQGENGMTLFESKGRITHIPTTAQEVFDVTGAGDTVVAGLGLALATNSNILDAAYLANYAAGIVVGKLGTATTTVEEIKEKIID